mmetsp:Transcript_3685/g.5158  ORF Transcript_3685/g.5158 Transcript_3685/m.5158 type:complete len:157 (+) Transcript_3685:40-510(+)
MENIDEGEAFRSTEVEITQVVTVQTKDPKTKKTNAVQTSLKAFVKDNQAPRQPKASERKIRSLPRPKSKQPPVAKKKSKTKSYNEPAKVKKLIAEFTKHRDHKSKGQTFEMTPEPFALSYGMLFCECCRETLCLHHNTIVRHCLSEKHSKSNHLCT